MLSKPKRLTPREHKEVLEQSAELVKRKPVAFSIVLILFGVVAGPLILLNQGAAWTLAPIIIALGCMISYCADFGHSVVWRDMFEKVKEKFFDIFLLSLYMIFAGSIVIIVTTFLPDEPLGKMHIDMFSNMISQGPHMSALIFMLGSISVFYSGPSNPNLHRII